jgi:glycosyltransferase involved in cell wall biosynthesis
MKITAFVNRNSGPSYHRLICPLMLMKGVDVFITNNLQEEHLKDCDIFLYNRIISELPKIQELKEKYGFRIGVDIDDFWELDPHHVLYDIYQKENFAKTQVEQLRQADFVLTTNQRLAAEIQPINQDVYVVPNAIPRQGQFDIEREPYHLTRLFWQGSITHRKDIEILERPIDQLRTIAPKIKMIMAGYHQEEEWFSMAMSYTAHAKHQYKLIEGAHVTEYYKAYAEADICLVPLVKSRFNSYKSNLKILEAANMGLPCIVSQCDPYLDMPLLYCKSGQDWVKHITRLVNSKKRRKEAGQELKEFCDLNYNFSKINEMRKQILEYQTARV